jgi:hypothetical protein
MRLFFASSTSAISRQSSAAAPIVCVMLGNVERSSLYDLAGGSPAFLALATAHHQRWLEDPGRPHGRHGCRRAVARRAQPLRARYRPLALTTAGMLVAARRRAVGDLLEATPSVTSVEATEWVRSTGVPDALADVHTPADLAAAGLAPSPDPR